MDRIARMCCEGKLPVSGNGCGRAIGQAHELSGEREVHDGTSPDHGWPRFILFAWPASANEGEKVQVAVFDPTRMISARSKRLDRPRG
jgi:hypothetical protein